MAKNERRIEFSHPAMWHDHDIDFARWLHPAMLHVALESCHDSEFTKWEHSAMWYVVLGWHTTEFARWQHPAMWQVALGWDWIRPNVRHIGILHLVLSSTISSQSTCHSAPVCEILSKSDHPLQKKMTSCRFSRWRISAILDFMGPIMGYLESPFTTSYRSSI